MLDLDIFFQENLTIRHLKRKWPVNTFLGVVEKKKEANPAEMPKIGT